MPLNSFQISSISQAELQRRLAQLEQDLRRLTLLVAELEQRIAALS